MDDVLYGLTAFFGMILIFVILAVVGCVVLFCISFVRQSWSDQKKAWKRSRENKAAGHLIRQVRSGRLGI